MTPYWLLFLLPVVMALVKPQPMPFFANRWPLGWWAMFFVLLLAIGQRHEVGGDWGSYFRHLELTYGEKFTDALIGQDPAYAALNWLVAQWGGTVHWVNTVCAAVFAWGLLTFCRAQPRPWLALAVAMPYLVVVVAMGYTRQGTAIGLVMLGLVALMRGSAWRFVLAVALAALFHKSAVILIPLAALASTQRSVWTLVWVAITTAAMYLLLLQESVEALTVNYLEAEYDSQGAAVRVAMNAVPAVLFIALRLRFGLLWYQGMFWTWMALGALAFVVLLAVSPSSTAVDRVALYWIPLQVFVLSRLPDALGMGEASEVWVRVVLGYGALVLFVWLVFAVHATYWLPYRFYPIELMLHKV